MPQGRLLLLEGANHSLTEARHRAQLMAAIDSLLGALDA